MSTEATTPVESLISEEVYTYSGLPTSSFHIRLLHLHPAEDTAAPLRCKLYCVPVDPPPVFSALSYTWGCDDKTCRLFVDVKGKPECRAALYLCITASLDGALRHLRHACDTLVLWIDQICINQTDLTEKTLQVSRMNTVYTIADEVLVWLGPAESNSDIAMDVWQLVGQDARDWGLESYYTRERLPELFRLKKPPAKSDSVGVVMKNRSFHALCVRSAARFLGRENLDLPEPDNFTAMSAMLVWYRRPWFARVWVLQEYALATKPIFICGYKRLDAKLLFLAMQIWGADPTTTCFLAPENGRVSMERWAILNSLQDEPVTKFVTAKARHEGPSKGTGPGNSLFELMRRLHETAATHEILATDPRDRIYGLLGLAVDSSELGIVPEYSIDTGAAQVYSVAVRAMIQRRTAHVEGEYLLDVFSLVHFPKKGPPGVSWCVESLPSWTPDLTRTIPSFCGRGISAAAPPPFFSAAGPDTKPRVLVTTGSYRILGLEGMLVDVIKDVGIPWLGSKERSDHEAYLSYLDEVAKMCRLSAELGDVGRDLVYKSPARRAEAVWRIPIGDVEEGLGRQGQRATKRNCTALRGFVQTSRLRMKVDLATSLADQAQRTRSSETEPLDAETLALCAEIRALLPELKARESSPEYPFEELFQSQMCAMVGKRPFVTRTGYVGMAPGITEPGDVVVVLFGGQTPFVLRPAAGEPEGFFNLLGEAYCDGIMDGEMLQKSETTDAFYLV